MVYICPLCFQTDLRTKCIANKCFTHMGPCIKCISLKMYPLADIHSQQSEGWDKQRVTMFTLHLNLCYFTTHACAHNALFSSNMSHIKNDLYCPLKLCHHVLVTIPTSRNVQRYGTHITKCKKCLWLHNDRTFTLVHIPHPPTQYIVNAILTVCDLMPGCQKEQKSCFASSFR